MSKTVEEKDLVIEVEGKEVNLSDIMSKSAVEAVKTMGLPVDDNGRVDFKAIPVAVQDSETRKEARLEKAANFIKQIVLPMQFHKEYGVKAIDTGSGSFGTVVVPELRDEILEQSARWYVIRKYAFVFQLTGKITLPAEGTGVTAYWVAENAAVTESNPTLTGVTLDDHGVAALVKVSWKLLRTSNVNIVNFVAALAGKAITDKEEAAFINGDGSAKPLGILQTTGITDVAQAGASYAYDDLVALYFALPAPYRQNAVFVTSSTGAIILHSLKDANDRPVFTIDGSEPRVLGKALLESDQVPANLGTGTDETVIYFGDPFTYWIKDGSDIEVATQDQIENLQTKIVVYKYVDGKIVNKAAWRKQTGVK